MRRIVAMLLLAGGLASAGDTYVVEFRLRSEPGTTPLCWRDAYDD